jgi:hypothetical protein
MFKKGFVLLPLLFRAHQAYRTRISYWVENGAHYAQHSEGFIAGCACSRNPAVLLRKPDLLPPSVLSGKRLVYVDPGARLAEAPEFDAVQLRFARSACAEFDL